MKNGPQSEQECPFRQPGTLAWPIQIDALPRVALSTPEMLPDCPGVYLALDNANRVWYIGMAESSVRERVKAHDRTSDFRRKSVTYIAWESVQRAACRGREANLIEFFHPPLNDVKNFNRMPEYDLGLTPEQEVERFLRLRIRLKVIELELEKLKPNIVTRCDQSGGKIQHRLGTIRAQEYKRWTYSKAVELLNVQLKAKRKEEELDGTAAVEIRLSPIAKINPEAMSEELAEYVSRLMEPEEDAALAEAV
jgi:hypothetical protein